MDQLHSHMCVDVLEVEHGSTAQSLNSDMCVDVLEIEHS